MEITTGIYVSAQFEYGIGEFGIHPEDFEDFDEYYSELCSCIDTDMGNIVEGRIPDPFTADGNPNIEFDALADAVAAWNEAHEDNQVDSVGFPLTNED